MLVKALANECNVNFISLNGVESLYMLRDHITEEVRNTFDKAREMAPCILFIDDLDCMCKKKERSMIIVIISYSQDS
jgi:transitional endoplasmic reticulum ATPase